MGFFDAAVCILFTTLAASYAWGMRGAVIGGEKGAMLPGCIYRSYFGLVFGRRNKRMFLDSCGGRAYGNDLRRN